MILAKNRMMGPTLGSARAGSRAEAGRPRGGSAVEQAAATHMEITFRLPAHKALEFMKRMQDASRGEGSPIMLWANPQGDLDILVREASGSASPDAGPLLATRAEYRMPGVAPVMPPERESMVAGDLAIHPGRHEVTYKGQMVPPLTYTEFGILHFLAKHAGWVFTREQIVEGVKGKDYPVTDRAVDVQVAGLRKKLGPAADFVQTVRGVGYRFKD